MDDDRHASPLRLDPLSPADCPMPAAAGPAHDGQLRALLESSRAPLRALFCQYRIAPEDAEDMVQDAALVLIHRWGEVRSPLSFLVGTVRHRILSHLARRRRATAARREIALRAEAAAGDVPQQRIDCREDARRLLARLPEAARPVVALRYGGGLPSREIALHLNRPEPHVRQTASRGLRRLRTYAETISFHG